MPAMRPAAQKRKRPAKYDFKSYKKPRLSRPQNVVGLYNRRTELKTVDTGATNTFSTTPVFQILNAIRLGNDDYQRVGKEIKMKSLLLTAQVQDLRRNSNAHDWIRYMIVYDRQTNGAAPLIADILSSVDINGGVTSTVRSAKNDNNKDRFKILLDQSFGISNDSNNGSNQAAQRGCGPFPTYIKHYIKLGGLITKFLSDAGGVPMIGSGSLYLVLYGNNTAAQANYDFNFNARLTYADY